MKKHIVIFIILAIIIIFITIFNICNYNGKTIIKNKSEETRSKEELLNLVSDDFLDLLLFNKYSNNDLKKIEKDIKEYNLDLESLDAKYKIECIREDNLILPNGGYRVVYRSKNKYLFVYFDKQGKKYWSNITEMVKEKSTYDYIRIGKDTKSKVFSKSLSSSTISDYFFSKSHNVKKSVHYTKDGYILIFDYDDKDIVRNIQVEII